MDDKYNIEDFRKFNEILLSDGCFITDKDKANNFINLSNPFLLNISENIFNKLNIDNDLILDVSNIIKLPKNRNLYKSVKTNILSENISFLYKPKNYFEVSTKKGRQNLNGVVIKYGNYPIDIFCFFGLPYKYNNLDFGRDICWGIQATFTGENREKQFNSIHDCFLEIKKNNFDNFQIFPTKKNEGVEAYTWQQPSYKSKFILKGILANKLTNYSVDNVNKLADDISNDLIKLLKTFDLNKYLFKDLLKEGDDENNKDVHISNIFNSIDTKPFIILSGISGTGKTQIARIISAAIIKNK